MSALQPVRGTRDIMPEEMRRQRRVVGTARDLAARYGYLEMSTPIFEFTDVFRRPLGETSDVVAKEMYSFTDRGDDEITLRPEATAAVCRAFLSEGLTQQVPCKFFCHGPMFRYDRPQKGRWRQFHQINVELIGVPEPLGDVEIIALGVDILDGLGVLGRITLELNTLGDPASRKAYREVLVEYFGDHRDRLSPDSRDRLSRNPLRILDSKDEGDRRVSAGAPLLSDHLNQESVDFFAKVKQELEALGIAYRLNSHLVRGLDYYTHTIFEFTTEDLGAQGSVLGGGRYDGLIEQLGGRPTPGIGFGSGMERLALNLKRSGVEVPEEPSPSYLVANVGEAARGPALELASRIRRSGGGAILSSGPRALRGQVRQANAPSMP